MRNRKNTLRLKIPALLLAAVLLLLTACGTSEPPTSVVAPTPPSVEPVVVLPLNPTPPPQDTEPPASPEPEITEPAVSPEPEISETPLPSEPPVSPEPETSPEPEVTEPVDTPEPEVSQPVESPSPEVSQQPAGPQADEYGIYAPRVGLYRLDTLTPVHEKAADEIMASASMSKIVTAVTALHYVEPDTVFTVGTELQLVQPGASTSFIAKGHRLTLYHLLMGMLLPSGCDASYTIAVNVARIVAEDPEMGDAEAVEYFCGLMNELAADLGAVNSHFVNPDGWDNDEHYTTVHDLALLAAHAMEYEAIREIVSTPEKWVMFASGENITWRNSNALLHAESGYYHPGAVGMKTGTTSKAGNCLLSVIEQDGVLYVAVVAGSPTRNGRYEDTLKLLELIPDTAE